MANWIELIGSRKPFRSASSQAGSEDNIDIWIEYDADRTTPTYTYIRFRGYPCPGHGGATSWVDSFLLFYNPNNNPNDGTRKLYTIKSNDELGGRWDKVECPDIKITKTYNASKFYIQDYWVCNNGEGNTASVWNQNISNAYKYFNEDRANYVQKGLGSAYYSIESDITVATDNTAYPPTITDNGDGTFDIKASKGTAGTNNSVISTTLKYKRIGTESDYKAHTSLQLDDCSISVADSVAEQRVYAKTTVKDKFDNLKDSNSTTKLIKNYVKPGMPGTPTLAASSKKNGRLTVKQNWTYTWTAATKINDSSPVKGYRIRIYKNGTAIKGLTCSTSNDTIGKDSGSSNYVDRESTNCTFTFNPITLGFVAGDKIYVTVTAYTRNGKNTQLFSTGGAKSADSTVQNAGIVHIKVNSQWKEGQVYVKMSGAWKEANSVHTKVSGSWKESQ